MDPNEWFLGEAGSLNLSWDCFDRLRGPHWAGHQQRGFGRATGLGEVGGSGDPGGWLGHWDARAGGLGVLTQEVSGSPVCTSTCWKVLVLSPLWRVWGVLQDYKNMWSSFGWKSKTIKNTYFFTWWFVTSLVKSHGGSGSRP